MEKECRPQPLETPCVSRGEEGAAHSFQEGQIGPRGSGPGQLCLNRSSNQDQGYDQRQRASFY
jgi:hypothetical protein